MGCLQEHREGVGVAEADVAAVTWRASPIACWKEEVVGVIEAGGIGIS